MQKILDLFFSEDVKLDSDLGKETITSILKMPEKEVLRTAIEKAKDRDAGVRYKAEAILRRLSDRILPRSTHSLFS